MNNITVQNVGSRISKWGEGPIWWEHKLIYVDIEGHALIELDPDSGKETVYEMGERIGTVVPRASGGYLCAGDGGIYTFDPASGKKENLADPEASMRPDNRFNDGKCDPAGRFWAGTISTVKDTGTANLYCLAADGSCTRKLPNLTNSNGICWSADASTIYHIDTPTQEVRAYDFDLASGTIDHSHVAVDTAAHGYASSPDGMTIDTAGMLWVAFCHGGCVVQFDPRKSKALQRIDLPCIETTACTFGGDQLDRLFVTTGIKRGLDEPEAGSVFVIDGLGAQGHPAFAFKG